MDSARIQNHQNIVSFLESISGTASSSTAPSGTNNPSVTGSFGGISAPSVTGFFSTAPSTFDPASSVPFDHISHPTTDLVTSYVSINTEVSIWLQENMYHNLCHYFRRNGGTRLKQFRDFFALFDVDELCEEFPELPKLVLYTIKSLLASLSDDDVRNYAIKTNSNTATINPFIGGGGGASNRPLQ